MTSINFKEKYVRQFRNLPHGEQDLVREFFNGKNNGFYVDLGANEPIIESQTYHLEKLGWQGLLIEPLPSYIKLLKEKRSGKVIEFACSSKENHGKILDIVVAGGHSTLNISPIAAGSESNETTKVTCRTLDSILEENNAPVGFDFISIDIEGHEMEMFKGFSLEYWKPKLILLEDHVITHEKHNYMTSHGHQIILRTGLNSWYVPKTELYRFSLSSKFEFFRKYWLGLGGRKLKYMK
jgi:FkbM family methyltransferase